MNLTSLTEAVRKPKVAISLVSGVVVIIVWIVAFVLPFGTKLSTDNHKAQALESQQAALKQQVAKLQGDTFNLATLEQQLATFRTLIPTDPGTIPYIAQIAKAAGDVGITLSSEGPGASTLVAGTKDIYAITVTITASGTFDQTLALIKAIYALPRLTSISSLTVTGGGVGTTRSTPLQLNLGLIIYAHSELPVAPTS